MPALLQNTRPILEGTRFLADIANGLVYLRGAQDIAALQREAHRFSGYVVAPGAANGAQGYVPESLTLMQGIKSCWDERGLLNPGSFILGHE
jgi:hypothetical protein